MMANVKKQAKVMQRDKAERGAQYKAMMDEILAGRGAPNDPRMLELGAREKRRMAATSKELSTMATGQPCQVIGAPPRG